MAAHSLDERHVALRAAGMNRARDQLFACAGLAGDEDGALRFRDQLGFPDHILHHPAATHDAVVIELLVAFTQQIPLMRAEP